MLFTYILTKGQETVVKLTTETEMPLYQYRELSEAGWAIETRPVLPLTADQLGEALHHLLAGRSYHYWRGQRDAQSGKGPLFRNIQGEWVENSDRELPDWTKDKRIAYMAGYQAHS